MNLEQDGCTVRLAGSQDNRALARLLGQLGYPASAVEVDERLVLPDPAREVLVASLGAELIGVLVWHRLRPLHVAPAWALISALVIDEKVRGKGAGARLLAVAEQRAKALGCDQVTLSSSVKREEAPRFYLAQGYRERPKRFVKPC